MICTICGKIVRDMRKHKLVHSGEKPFQCDRCSYRCSRSGTLKRHMATHLNSNQYKVNPGSLLAPETTVSTEGAATTVASVSNSAETTTNTLPLSLVQAPLELPVSLEQQQIPMHIPHHEATGLQEPKYIELTAQQLAQHLPPHSTYGSPQPTTSLPSVAYREYKFQ